jgi:hypothetical protein
MDALGIPLALFVGLAFVIWLILATAVGSLFGHIVARNDPASQARFREPIEPAFESWHAEHRARVARGKFRHHTRHARQL